MPTLEIDGRAVTVEDGANVIQAAGRLGIEIPHYCYHPGLSIAGNCRMCLVEIEKLPKLQVACNTRATEGMVVRTTTDRVKHAREAVLEFLLINHPVDCPICDQAGECKLQDYYMDYDRGGSRIRLDEKVRKRKALDIGPLVKLDQERCILCTRCVRFCDEVAGTGELGLFERGDRVRVDVFRGRQLDNPYSGNVVDICPVGALTSADFRFQSRVWFLERTPSICPGCATGCNIDINHRRGEIFRFRPRANHQVNRWWMCDEGRLSYRRYQGEQRVLQPFVREGGELSRTEWSDALRVTAQRLGDLRQAHGQGAVAGVISAQATNEEAYLFARLCAGNLGGAPVAGLAWSPPGASRDDFLRDADKNPNTRGLRALGIDTNGGDDLIAAIESGKVRGLFAFRVDLAALLETERLRALARGLDCLVVADADGHETAAQADVVLPLASFAEMDGTFTNRSGRVQRIRAAFPPPGEAKAGWRMLSDLGQQLGGSDDWGSAAAVLEEIAASCAPFAGLTSAVVGERGAVLRQE